MYMLWYSSPQCYMALVEIGPQVPEKIFQGFLPLYGQGSHLSPVTCIIYVYIGSHLL